MHDAQLVAVPHRVRHLLEQRGGAPLREVARAHDGVEQLPPRGQLQDEVDRVSVLVRALGAVGDGGGWGGEGLGLGGGRRVWGVFRF